MKGAAMPRRLFFCNLTGFTFRSRQFSICIERITRMKKLMLLLAVLTTVSAHATKARLVALSQDSNGSYYIMDTRNIFLNPAQLSIMKDHLNFEWGKQDRPGVATEVPENEGGFVMSLGAGKIAAQLGRVTDFDRLVREINSGLPDTAAALTTGGTVAEGQNALDLMYSGGNSLHWGAGVAIERSKNSVGSPDKQASVQGYELRGGVHTDVWEAFGGLIVASESKTDVGTTNGKIKEPVGVRLGGGFQYMPNMRGYASLGYDKYSATVDNGSVDYDGKRLNIGVGNVYVRNLEENARLFAAVELNYLDHKDSNNKSGQPDEQLTVLQLPVTLGIEADANSWARIRASVRQNVLLGTMHTTVNNPPNDSQKWENAPNSTSVAAGVGASANRFNFDLAVVQPLRDDASHVEVAMTYIF
jgi:hypothetical protein